jgi:cellulose biosynthesis protein BcsE
MRDALCSIAISGLPPRNACFVPGALYAVAGEDERILDTTVVQTLLAAGQGVQAVLATARAPRTMLAHRGLPRDAFRTAVGDGGIRLLAHAGAAPDPVGFVDAFLADALHFGVPPGSFLILDGAECLFAGTDCDGKVLARLRNWAEDCGIACLLVCRSDAALPCLLERSHQLAGLAGVQANGLQATWDVFHWAGKSGLAGAQSFELEFTGDAALAVLDSQAPAASGHEPAGDEHLVIVARPAVQPAELAPVDWIICENVPSLELRAASAVAATIVLPFTGSAGFDRLARAVYGIRKNCGSHLKIVVREINIRLRYSQEALIMRLGANMVIPAEVGFSRLRGLLAVVRHQVYAHRLPRSFDEAMRERAPKLEHGYLAPSAFVQATLAVLGASGRLGLQDILVRLPLGYGLQPLDALRYCAISREGDLCTADDAHVYLLLHACREADIAFTLDRLFKLPVGEFFTSETSYMAPKQIAAALDDLQVRHDVHGYADLTAELASTSHGARPAPASKAPAPEAGPREIRHSAPPPAQRRPLKTRNVLSLVETESEA